MDNLIDMQQYLKIMSRSGERYRAFIIYGEPVSGKTDFIYRLSHTVNARYIDLLSTFRDNKELKEIVDRFTPALFKNYCLELTFNERVIIFDQIDFLINTWIEKQKDEFLSIVETLNQSETDKVFCFVLQEDSIVHKKQLKNSQGQDRILNLREIKEI